MEHRSPGLRGHKGLRGDVLVALKKTQPQTAKELAVEFAVSGNAIRRHLKELEAEGLVSYEREQRGTGAPTFEFRLSEAGEALFPSQYDQVLADVLAQVAQDGGRGAVRELFVKRFRDQAERLQDKLANASLEQKADAVVQLLSQQGFMAEWSVQEGALRIAEHNCGLRNVAQQFPEICAAEIDFLRDVLQSRVERDAYIQDGCNACEYSVNPIAAAEANAGQPQERT